MLLFISLTSICPVSLAFIVTSSGNSSCKILKASSFTGDIFNFQGCEREVIAAEKDSSEEFKSECRLRLSWALVHSKFLEDVLLEINIIEGEQMIYICLSISSCIIKLVQSFTYLKKAF